MILKLWCASRTAELEAANASLKKEIAERSKFEGVVQAILK